MPPVIFVGSQSGATIGNAIRFEIPSAAKARDVAIMAVSTTSTNAGPDVDALEADGWEAVGTIVGATHTLWIYRRALETGDPAHIDCTFVDPLVDPAIGAMLVYRNLDPGAAVIGASGTNVAASTLFPCPSRTLTRYSDVYIGIAVMVDDEVTFTPPAGGTERIEYAADAMTIEAFDILPETSGATGVETTTAASPGSGIAASIALAANALIGFGKSFTIDPMGAIGLPSKGV